MKNRRVALSVCVPTFNRATLLKQTLFCLSKQTKKPYEVIIVDNASTDNTSDIVKKYAQFDFTYIRNRQNIGLMKNINRCIKLASGTHIVFLHSDDLVSPQWYESLLTAIRNHEAMLYTTPIVIINEGGGLKYICHIFDKSRLVKQPNTVNEFWSKLSTGISPNAATVFDMKVFKKYGLFNLKYETEADALMNYQLFLEEDVYFLRKWVYAHRSHSLQGFDRKREKRSLNEEIHRLDNHFSIIKALYEKYKRTKNSRYFIQVPLFMTITPINLYIVKLQFKRIILYYKTAFKYFPDLFNHTSDWIVFVKVQTFFIGRALLGQYFARRDKYLAPWLEKTVRELNNPT